MIATRRPAREKGLQAPRLASSPWAQYAGKALEDHRFSITASLARRNCASSPRDRLDALSSRLVSAVVAHLDDRATIWHVHELGPRSSEVFHIEAQKGKRGMIRAYTPSGDTRLCFPACSLGSAT